jgi:hypothetical protein
MVQEILLENYQGDYSFYQKACYQIYLDFWATQPKFQGKIIQRHISIGIIGQEKVFRGIVKGHDMSKKRTSCQRYQKLPLLSYLVNRCNSDICHFKRMHKGKIRIEIFSQQYCYLMVLEEIKQTNKLQFITAHPLDTGQLSQKLNRVREYEKSNFIPL